MPLVAVWMVTYNHGAYIRKAIESVMMQKTSFDFKLLIGEDKSTDNTRAICLELKKKYPKKIELFLNETNIGATANGTKMYQVCYESGARYVALIEGDDFWTDETKLEQQVKFLENNEFYALCFHEVYNLINGKRKKPVTGEVPETSDINYLLSHSGYISTVSVVYRNNERVVTMLKNMQQTSFGDFVAYVAASQEGLIKYIRKPLAVYRIHGSGVWSTLDAKKIFENMLLAYKMLFAQLPKQQGEMLKIRYLIAVEKYFLENDSLYTKEEFDKLMENEMGVDPYVIQYISNNCEKQKQAAYYAARVPIHILLKSIWQKLLNKIKG